MQHLALLAILKLWLISCTYGFVPQIIRLNALCDRTGMQVVVDFDIPFNGIIYSKGHFSDAYCRYVNQEHQGQRYAFYIPTDRCGTISTENRRDGSIGFKNVIIIQNDPDYQEVWDMVTKISCDWVTRIDKFVPFRPFVVDTVGIKEINFIGDTVDCWMDIKRGHGPFAPTITGVVPIGDPITIVIYIKDKDKSFDVRVKDCYAYDNPDYKAINTRKLQLTDSRGCIVKEKIVRGFFRTRDVRNSGATIIAYGIIKSFKFPERMDVFLTCNVEVCKGGCDNPCQSEVPIAGVDSVAIDGETPPIVQTETEASVSISPAVTESNVDEEVDESDESLDSEESLPNKHVAVRISTNSKEKLSESTKSTVTVQSAKIKSNNRSRSNDVIRVVGNGKSNKVSPKRSKTNETTKKPARIVNTNNFDRRPICKNKGDKDCRLDVNKKVNVSRMASSKKKRKLTTVAPPNELNESEESVEETTTRLSSPARLRRTKNSQNNGISREQTRNRRSILVSNGNATFADMTHSISIISPVEDFDEKELEIWEKAKYEQNRVCVAVIDLILSSFILIWLLVVVTIGLVVFYRKKRDLKCDP